MISWNHSVPLWLCAAATILTFPVCGCGDDEANGPSPPDGIDSLSLGRTLIASGLNQPVDLTAPMHDSSRVFIVERPGRIRIVHDGTLLSTPFLDITDSVLSNASERGLLGLAFHPSYASNGQFVVNYTGSDGQTHIARFAVTADPDVADRGSETTLLLVPQFASNHNGGQVRFGPDGMLYIGLGDGGGGGDPQQNGQDSTTLLGSLLRIDVDGTPPYTIPGDNPFAGHPTARGEIWAYGLRNPWRFSFDRETGDLYIADVGQSAREEIDVEQSGDAGGGNYGWNRMEGASCFDSSGCSTNGLILPVVEYDHNDGCSITGGYVYRGSAIPELAGHYFYGDFCGGWVRSFRFVGGQATTPTDWERQLGIGSGLSSFGEDARGELYLVDLGGSVYRITSTTQ